MTSDGVVRPGAGAAQSYGQSPGREPANLGDILERVLDRGLVIAGDIRVNLLDIELLTIKLRLVIASADTAKQLGIDWWTTDPWLSSKGSDQASLKEENRALRDRVAELESGERPAVRGGERGGGRRTGLPGEGEESRDLRWGEESRGRRWDEGGRTQRREDRDRD